MEARIARALGPLAPVYGDPAVGRIFADGANAVYCARGDVLEDLDLPALDGPGLNTIINELFLTVDRRLDGTEGFASCRLADGTTVRAVFPPLAPGGPALTLEKLPARRLAWDDLRDEGFVDEAGQKVLDALLRSGESFLVAGQPGAGRSTFASLLVDRVPPGRRVILAERQIALMPGSFRGLRLEARPDGPGAMAELVRVARELAPDLLFVHELEGAEAEPLVELMRGGMAVVAVTGASGVADALRRLELFLLREGLGLPVAEIRAMICDGLRFVSFQRRLPGGRRVLEEITRLDGLDGDRYRLTVLHHRDEETRGFVLAEAGRRLLEEA